MTEQIRVRDLIEYLKQQDPDAKVTAGGVRMLWEAPKRTDKGNIDLKIGAFILAEDVASHIKRGCKGLRDYAYAIRKVALGDEGASEALDEIASDIFLTANSLEEAVTP